MVADEERLQQVLWNLASNAVKFTPAGGSVQVTATREGSQLHIAMADSGVGISPEFLPRVFNKFEQADRGSSRAGGLGLGLAIVRQVVELHGGTVEVQSEGVGKGSRFSIHLPIRAGVRTSDAPLSQSSVRDSSLLAGMKIVVVDDEDEAREILTEILVRAGANVRAATNAAECVAHLQEEAPDVLISDIGMPGQDGYALIQAVRRLDSPVARVAAVALTAMARPMDRMKALAAGFNAHVTKPVEPLELVIVVATLLGRQIPVDEAGIG